MRRKFLAQSLRPPILLRAILIGIFSIMAGGVAFSIAEGVSVGTGLYWALTTAVTVGYGDVTPKDTPGRLVAVGVMIVAIPAAGAVFSHLTAWHLHRRMIPHMEEIRETAHKAHQIAADLFEHHTGNRHPDHPEDKER